MRKRNEGYRNKGALKAQLHIARGETPGHATSPSIYARCKCNYIPFFNPYIFTY